jgi:hypothetical protein
MLVPYAFFPLFASFMQSFYLIAQETGLPAIGA